MRRGQVGEYLRRILHVEHIRATGRCREELRCLWHLEEMYALGQRYRGPNGESGVCPKGGVDA